MMLRVPSVVYHPFGLGRLGDDCTDADGNPVSCDSGSGGSGGSGAPAVSNDWQAITGCVGPDSTGFDCGACGPGYALQNGGCITSTSSASTNPANYCPSGYTYNGAGSCIPNSGSTSGGSIPANTAGGAPVAGNTNSLTNFLNSLAAQTPKIISTITGNPVGGATNYTPFLISAAVLIGAVVLMNSGGRR